MDIHKFNFGMCEGFLLILTQILTSRLQTGINVDRLREIIIHQLWLGKTPASKFTKYDMTNYLILLIIVFVSYCFNIFLRLFPNDTKKIMEILHEVANFSEATAFKNGGYLLKKEYYKEYSLFYPFYSSQERQTSELLYFEYQEQEAKNQVLNLNLPFPLYSTITHF
jgi:hypothetical protein